MSAIRYCKCDEDCPIHGESTPPSERDIREQDPKAALRALYLDATSSTPLARIAAFDALLAQVPDAGAVERAEADASYARAGWEKANNGWGAVLRRNDILDAEVTRLRAEVQDKETRLAAKEVEFRLAMSNLREANRENDRLRAEVERAHEYALNAVAMAVAPLYLPLKNIESDVIRRANNTALDNVLEAVRNLRPAPPPLTPEQETAREIAEGDVVESWIRSLADKWDPSTPADVRSTVAMNLRGFWSHLVREGKVSAPPSAPPAAPPVEYATLSELYNDLANECDETRTPDEQARLKAAMHALVATPAPLPELTEGEADRIAREVVQRTPTFGQMDCVRAGYAYAQRVRETERREPADPVTEGRERKVVAVVPYSGHGRTEPYTVVYCDNGDTFWCPDSRTVWEKGENVFASALAARVTPEAR